MILVKVLLIRWMLDYQQQFQVNQLTLFRLGFFGPPWTGGGGGRQTPPFPTPFLKNYKRYRHETYTTD